MKKHFINPPSSPRPKSYHHAVSVEGGRTIYFAGQVAFNKDREVVGGKDLMEQTRQALRNLRNAVEAAGAHMGDMVQITTHVVAYKPEQMDVITRILAEFFPAESVPANTLVGVESLSTAGLLIEIGGIAVTDAPIP